MVMVLALFSEKRKKENKKGKKEGYYYYNGNDDCQRFVSFRFVVHSFISFEIVDHYQSSSSARGKPTKRGTQ